MQIEETHHRRITTELVTAEGRVWAYTVDEAEGDGSTHYLASPQDEAVALRDSAAHLENLLSQLKPVISREAFWELDLAIGDVEASRLMALQSAILALFPHEGNEVIYAQRDRPRGRRLPASEAQRWRRVRPADRALVPTTRLLLWRVLAGHCLMLALGLAIGAAIVAGRARR